MNTCLRPPPGRLCFLSLWLLLSLLAACGAPQPSPAKTPAASPGPAVQAVPPAGAQLDGAPAEASVPMLPLWRVAGPSGTEVGYLLGSVHLLPESDSALPEQVMTAFEAAGALVVEVDVTAAQADNAMALRMAQMGMYPAGESLRQHVPEALFAQVKARALAQGLPEVALDRMRPWLLAMTLSVSQMAAQGFSAELGVDLRLLQIAHRQPSEKPVLALETVESQLLLFSSLTEEEQVSLLRDTLLHLDMPDEMRTLHALWKAGDTLGLAALLFAPLREDPTLAPFYERFYFERNRAMADNLLRIFAQPRSHFVVVGAAHLVGEGSVVQLLREKGYRVTQVAALPEGQATPAQRDEEHEGAQPIPAPPHEKHGDVAL